MYHSGYEKYESSTGRRFFSPMSAAGFFPSNEVCGSGPTGGFTKAHFSQNTATNNTNAPKTIRKNGRTLRFRKRFSFSRIARSRLRDVTAHFSGDQKRCDENQDVRKIDENVGLQRNLIEVRNKINDDINQIPRSENVKIDSRAARRSQRADHAERTRGKMSEIHDARHVEQAEHQPVRVHDSRNVVEEVNAEKQRRKSPCTLLDRRYLFRHSKLSENVKLSIVTLYCTGKQQFRRNNAKDNVPFAPTALADRVFARGVAAGGGR